MWYKEIIAVCSVIHTKYILTLYRQNAELLNAEATGLRRVNFNPSYVMYLVTPSLEQNAYLFKVVFLLYSAKNNCQNQFFSDIQLHEDAPHCITHEDRRVCFWNDAFQVHTHTTRRRFPQWDWRLQHTVHGHPEQQRSNTLRLTTAGGPRLTVRFFLVSLNL